MLLAMGICMVPGAIRVSAAETDVSKMAFVSCSKGDRLDITLGKLDVSWESSDSNVASVDAEGVVSVVSEGSCDLVNSDTGFTVKVNASGETSETGILNLDYTVNSEELKSVVRKDSTVSVETVEVNSTVQVDETDVPDGFSKENSGGGAEGTEEDSVDGTNSNAVVEEVSTSNTKVVTDPKNENIVETVDATVSSGGIFTTEDVSGNTKVVKVIDPKINSFAYYGSVGNTINVNVSETVSESVTYTSENTEIATVDENGLVSLIGEGETYVVVSTGTNDLRCKIVSVKPMVDTSDVIVTKGETEKIVVKNNFAELPVSFELVSGDGSVSESGEVSVNSGTVKVRVMVGSFAYEKSFTLRPTYYYTNSANLVHGNHAEYWEAMQPFIQESLGIPYSWGGSSPAEGGMDCSGYVSYVLRNVGLISGRPSAQGLYNMCAKTDNPQPGDLVFFQGTYDTAGISHVGIYAGDGMMYHSGDPNQLASFNTPFWQSHFVGYGTLITESSGDSGVSGYSQEELELIWAIVAQEDNGSYEGALAVITSAMNRADQNYGGHGTDALSQLTAPGQYCYSPEVSDPALYQARLNGNVPEYVKQAVSDCLVSGLRNHEYLNFRSSQAPGRVQIGGNWFF